MSRRGPSEPTRVAGVLGRVLDDLGFGGARLAMRVQERWPELAGAEAAAHSAPEMLRGAILDVRVDASVWGQQLQLKSPGDPAGPPRAARRGRALGASLPGRLSRLSPRVC